MLMAAAIGSIETYPAFALTDPARLPDSIAALPGPGIFGLVALGIAVAVGIARWRK
jgi:hypothetical protein